MRITKNTNLGIISWSNTKHMEIEVTRSDLTHTKKELFSCSDSIVVKTQKVIYKVATDTGFPCFLRKYGISTKIQWVILLPDCITQPCKLDRRIWCYIKMIPSNTWAYLFSSPLYTITYQIVRSYMLIPTRKFVVIKERIPKQLYGKSI